KQFLDVARLIYKNDDVWVCPLDNAIEEVFDPATNPYFSHGEAQRWILLDDNNKPAGRIAAFIDKNIANSYDQPTGGIGFFECINDKKSAFVLFDTARKWLGERGMEAMDGPVNFGETDKYWGLLVDGFTHPSFDVPYNPPYYKQLFEDYGFMVYYKMEGFHLDITKPISDRFRKIAEWIENKPGYKFRHFRHSEKTRMMKDFAEVYNQAWSSFKMNFEPLEVKYVNAALKKAAAIFVEEFLWIAYFEGKPIAIFLMFPDLNQIIKHFNGKLNIWNKIRFLYLKNRHTMTRTKVLMMGIVPKFQGHGIESAFILNAWRAVRKKGYFNEAEFSWVADFNPKMKKILLSVGCIPVKHYITYRYLFDRTKEFKRYPIPDIRFHDSN
ncbi:MAG TPA: hypothetical protein VJ963_01320, partial [Bacteroidales bacterium]|nr:hypothetical protein [Bacteroidales bacterium]